ncbi:TPA: methyltransferase domain-containing protein [Candidatus Woesearchaeota archaeon]|nr:tRNA (Adenine-N(1)-)-methyltransferase [archaeon GW2011_AR15]MBS3103331.1 methyltransferase domain-containing protein [Candidatus Woesearchaeota archaeon]HIH41058.1 methyltransferase domain-containing protein [Candidatus Woesearchaeota archaeon]
MSKLIATKDNWTFLVKDPDKDVHTNFGLIKAEDIKKAKAGEIVKSNKGIEFTVFDADFIDFYHRIKRGPQIIPRKDIGLIIAEAGLNKNSVVIESGSGSGGLGCFLAKICKKVYSYEIREDFYNIAKKNVEYLGIKNLSLKNRDAKEGFSEKNADTVILDLPDPWELIEAAKKSLKPGGFLISYSPTIPQVMDFVNTLDESFAYLKTSEIIEREWEVKERKVRPRSQAIGHSGFITFARKL